MQSALEKYECDIDSIGNFNLYCVYNLLLLSLVSEKFSNNVLYCMVYG